MPRLRRVRPLRVQSLEDRRLLTAAPLGATGRDTGEFLLGTVAVTPVLFESDGSIDEDTQDWTAAEIDALLSKVQEGVNWWSETLDRLGSVHSLEFIVDDAYASTPIQTGYEPISRVSNAFQYYAGDFLGSLGYGDADSFEDAVFQFNDAQRNRLGTDWAFTIFVADSSDDSDGQFDPGGSFANAFAFPGGQFVVTPSTRPASTITHEMGHIFWARDEYPGGGSWTDRRGYYDAQNTNAANNPTPGFEQQDSIMRSGFPLSVAYNNHTSPASTLAMIGWLDSDGDGIFDVADVPLQLDAVGYFDAVAGLYHFRGTASAVPLLNQNSSGNQSDITLNRVSRLEYQLDDGPWIVAATPDSQRAEFELSLPIETPLSTIRWRVVDAEVGVTSPVIEAAVDAVAISAAAVTGYAYVDQNKNGTRDPQEQLLSDATVRIQHADGSPLFAGTVDPSQRAEGELAGSIGGANFTAEGPVTDGRVGVFTSSAVDGRSVLHGFNLQQNRWVETWSEPEPLVIEFDQPIGQLTLEVIGVDADSYGRVAAYDASGNLIARATSEILAAGESALLRVSDSAAQISQVRAFGHARTTVALGALSFGTADEVVTDESGSWSFSHFPDGNYRVEIDPRLLVHQFAASTVDVTVSGGASEPIDAAVQLVASPRHNAEFPEDVDENGLLTAVDALLVINDLYRSESRVLGEGETTGPRIDVNNDGAVTAIDALRVINALNRSAFDGEAEIGLAAGGQPLAVEIPLQNPPSESEISPFNADLALTGWQGFADQTRTVSDELSSKLVSVTDDQIRRLPRNGRDSTESSARSKQFQQPSQLRHSLESSQPKPSGTSELLLLSEV